MNKENLDINAKLNSIDQGICTMIGLNLFQFTVIVSFIVLTQ